MGKEGRFGGVLETGVSGDTACPRAWFYICLRMVGLLFEKTTAAGFEFFVRTADAVVFHAG